MIYLDAKSDIAFKKLFGNIAHKEVLISFLNSVLERTEGAKITDVTINDPANVPDTLDAKMSIVDVRCTDQGGSQYIVEMQVVSQLEYPARAQYYSSLVLSRQLAVRQSYKTLVPVIFVGILKHALFESPSYLSHHLILDSETHVRELKHLEFHFVELEKFDKQEAELQTVLDKWIYLLKNADLMQARPDSFREPELGTALDILAQGNWSLRELEAYDKYLDAFRTGIDQLGAAEERGAIRVATKMLQEGYSLEAIVKLTDLPIDTIEKLKTKL